MLILVHLIVALPVHVTHVILQIVCDFTTHPRDGVDASQTQLSCCHLHTNGHAAIWAQVPHM